MNPTQLLPPCRSPASWWSLLWLVALLSSALPAQITFSYSFAPGTVVPDQGQFVDTRVIANPGFSQITDVQVRLQLSNPTGDPLWAGDLYATLTHGTALETERVSVLLNRPGRTLANSLGNQLPGASADLTFADTAATSAATLSAVSGTYRPDGRLGQLPTSAPDAGITSTHPLASLSGAWLPSNRWSLLLADVESGDQARLDAWSIVVQGTAGAGDTLNLSNALAVFTGDSTSRVVIGSGGSAQFTGRVTGEVTLDPGASATFTNEVAGPLTVTGGTAILSGPVTGNLSIGTGGTVSLGTGSSLSQSTLNNQGLLRTEHSGGTAQTFSTAITGTGTLEKTGTGQVILTGNNTFTGPTLITGGTLTINGALTASPVTVGSGGTLGGSGVFGSTVTVQGNLSPGNSPGLLTFDQGLTLTGSSTTSFELAGPARGTQYDAINVNGGTLTYAGTLDLRLTVPLAAGTFDLFQIAGGATTTGSFAQVTIGGSAFPGSLSVTGTGWSGQIDDKVLSFLNSTGDLSVSVIPEASTLALWTGLGGLLLVAGRRRRRVGS